MTTKPPRWQVKAVRVVAAMFTALGLALAIEGIRFCVTDEHVCRGPMAVSFILVETMLSLGAACALFALNYVAWTKLR